MNMLIIEPQEMNAANKLLTSIGVDMESIDFIHKDNTYYHAKTKEEFKDFLSYLISKYPNISDIHIAKDGIGIKLYAKINGKSQNLNAISISANNYTTIEIDGITFVNTYFNRHIKNIVNPHYVQEDFIDEISIPLCGSYQLRSATAGQDASIRLLKINNLVDKSLIRNNVLYLLETPYCIMDDDRLESCLDVKSVELNETIKQQLVLYKKTVSQIFNHLTGLSNIRFEETDLRVKLEQKNNEEITAIVLKKYRISTYQKDMAIDYLINNYEVFYHPIFAHFIDSCTGVEKDSIIGEFKSPEALKDYLIAIKMLEI